MDDKPLRAFIALDLPDVLKKEIEELLFRLKKAGADVKWVHPQNMHLTLKFLGDTPPDRIALVKSSLDDLGARQKPFQMHCAGLGGFPDLNHPRVLWAGVDEGEEALKALADAVESEAAKIGFPREDRAFSAHLTLGRVRGRMNLERLVREMKAIPFSSAEKAVMDHLTLYKSILTKEGSVYEPIHVVRFGGMRA